MSARRVAAVVVGLAALVAVACRSGGPSDAPVSRDPVPTVGQIAGVWNARVARLDRLWARTVVTMRYLDAEGEPRSAQGEGHLQRLDWYKVALSVGKLGETFFWFGGDRDRFWFFDLASGEMRRVVFGTHERLTRDKGQLLSIPVPPRQYMRFAGLSAFPTRIDGATVRRVRKGVLEVSFQDRSGDWVYEIEESTMHPLSITAVDAEGEPEVRSALSDYKTVQLENPGSGIFQAPSRIVIEHVPSETSITLAIDGQMIDGRRSNKPRAGAFDFEALVEALGPIDDAIDLDEVEDVRELELLSPVEEAEPEA